MKTYRQKDVILETKRLIFLPLYKSYHYIENLYQLRSDLDVMKYLGKPQTKEEVKNMLDCSENYFKQFGLDFFCVLKRESGECIGQAGLIHVSFNIDSDIELAYRFHKKFWHQGYATECALALIDWGFKYHHLPKIVSFVHPDNENSRHVLEKAGFVYYGFKAYRETKIPYFEIHNPEIDLAQLIIKPATIEDYPIIQNLSDLYAYDLSRYMKWPLEKDGRADSEMDYMKYWQTPNTYPFLIYYQDNLVGFVIVDKEVTNLENDFNMAQFFINQNVIGRGIGTAVANYCFQKFPGRWEIFVMPGNEGAYQFWRKTIKRYTHGHFFESTKIINNRPRNIFEFDKKSDENIPDIFSVI